MSCAYVVKHVCWQAQAAVSSHEEQVQHVRHSSAVSPFEQEIQLLLQTELSGTEHGNRDMAVDTRRNEPHLKENISKQHHHYTHLKQ